MTDIVMNTDTWNNAGDPAKKGSQGSSDITDVLSKAVQSLCDSLNTISFMENANEFLTAVEDFGHGMIGALACVGVDLAVVGSGVKAAASAYASLENELTNTLQQLDTQLGYYTNTTTSTVIKTPSAAQEAALQSLGTSLSESNPWWQSWFPTLPQITIQPPPPEVVAATATVLFIIGIIALSPFGL